MLHDRAGQRALASALLASLTRAALLRSLVAASAENQRQEMRCSACGTEVTGAQSTCPTCAFRVSNSFWSDLDLEARGGVPREEGAELLAGRYRLEDRIACGGMGVVHRGLDTATGTPV